MKSRLALFTVIILALLLASCATAAPTRAAAATSAPAYSQGALPAVPAPGLPSDNFTTGNGGGSKSNDVQNPAVQRLVIKNADMTIAVADPASGMTAIINMANTMGGYVVSSKSFKTQAQDGSQLPQATISVRVPAAKLDDALAVIRKLTADPAHDIQSENVTGQDVTADYVDLQSRLTSLQNTQEQLIKIQDAATKTEDVLAVFNQLSQINQQIEQVKGQMKYDEDAAALSGINVNLLALASVNPVTIGGWQPVGVVRDAFQSLIDVGKFLLAALIWIVIFFVPIGLVFFFPGRWAWRAYKRRQAARRYPQPMAAGGMPYPPQGPGGQPPQYPDIK